MSDGGAVALSAPTADLDSRVTDIQREIMRQPKSHPASHADCLFGRRFSHKKSRDLYDNVSHTTKRSGDIENTLKKH